jgi:transposase
MSDAPARPAAPLDEAAYTLTIDDAADRYDAAGFPRPTRRLQKYCARGDLECRKIETSFGERYLITAESVDRHIAYIKETADAAGRAPARPAAPGRLSERKEEIPIVEDAPEPAPPRPAASSSDLTIFEHPYVKRLEAEVDEFKGKYEKQVRRTEEIQEAANLRLVEMAQAGQIAGSKTLAEYLLAAKNVPMSTDHSTS